jgi:hypothetical protein
MLRGFLAVSSMYLVHRGYEVDATRPRFSDDGQLRAHVSADRKRRRRRKEKATRKQRAGSTQHVTCNEFEMLSDARAGR